MPFAVLLLLSLLSANPLSAHVVARKHDVLALQTLGACVDTLLLSHHIRTTVYLLQVKETHIPSLSLSLSLSLFRKRVLIFMRVKLKMPSVHDRLITSKCRVYPIDRHDRDRSLCSQRVLVHIEVGHVLSACSKGG